MEHTEKKIYLADRNTGIAQFQIHEITCFIGEDGTEQGRSKMLSKDINPDDDISMYPAEIQGMCNGYWTDEVKAAWTAFQEAQAVPE
jgi:hypothetical protein